jgi:hypothetical protein
LGPFRQEDKSAIDYKIVGKGALLGNICFLWLLSDTRCFAKYPSSRKGLDISFVRLLSFSEVACWLPLAE